MVVFLDPSGEAPGWPLQNVLALLSQQRPGRRQVLCFRDPQLARGSLGSAGKELFQRPFRGFKRGFEWSFTRRLKAF